MTMKDKLAARLDYLNPHVRSRVIDDVLQALSVPTPFMIEDGAHAIKRSVGTPLPMAQAAEDVFVMMIHSAMGGG